MVNKRTKLFLFYPWVREPPGWGKARSTWLAPHLNGTNPAKG